MKPINLRAKFAQEQYIAAFEFPENVVTFPTVWVDLISGDDPHYVDVAGWLFITGATVGVLISGGLPGCVYRISCECFISGDAFVVSGILSVHHSEGLVPDGFVDAHHQTPTIPFTQDISSRLYPILFQESAEATLIPTGGILKLLVIPARMAPDESTSILVPTGGIIRDPIVHPLFIDGESGTLIPTGGTIISALVYGKFIDAASGIVVPTTGAVRPVPQALAIDEMSGGIVPISGSIYV